MQKYIGIREIRVFGEKVSCEVYQSGNVLYAEVDKNFEPLEVDFENKELILRSEARRASKLRGSHLLTTR